MCVAIPMKLVARSEIAGTAELRGVSREVNLMLVPESREGDFVLVHAGYAIGVVDEGEARKTLALIESVLGQEVQP